jgi:hypothetical protein
MPGPDEVRIGEPLLGPVIDGAFGMDEGKNELSSSGKTGRIPLIVVRKIRDTATVMIAALFERRPQ